MLNLRKIAIQDGIEYSTLEIDKYSPLQIESFEKVSIIQRHTV